MFPSKPHLLIHSQQVHRTNPKPYQCSTCNKCFANSSYLSQHSRIHLGIKPYICPLCHRRFTQLCHLQQHIRTHTGEKPYKCQHSGCTKAFSQLSNLQSHLRSHVTGHVYGPRISQRYRCHSCCQGSVDVAAANEASVSEACRYCRMIGLTQRTADIRDLNSVLSYQMGLRQENAAIPKIRHRMLNNVHPRHTGGSNDETTSTGREMPALSLGNLSVAVSSEKGEEDNIMATLGSDEREHDLSTRGKDTYLRHFYDSQARKYPSETRSCSSILSNSIPWCCGATRGEIEKCEALSTLGTHSSTVTTTAKKGAFFDISEINARMKMCSALFNEMSTGLRDHRDVSGTMENERAMGLLPAATCARMKTCSSPFDEFGTRRKTFDVAAVDGSRGSKNPSHQSDRKETLFSEVPRVNIDQPLSSLVDVSYNSPLFPSSYNPF